MLTLGKQTARVKSVARDGACLLQFEEAESSGFAFQAS